MTMAGYFFSGLAVAGVSYLIFRIINKKGGKK